MIKDFLEQFVFFPNKELKKTPSNIDIIYEDVFLNLNNNKIHGWFIKSTEKIVNTKNKVILFFHGNAGNISFRLYYIKKFYDLGF